MNSAEYWRGRFSLLEDTAHARGSRCVDGLEAIYRDAERTVQADLERWYSRFAANNNVSLYEARKMLTTSQLKEFRWTVEQYIEAAQRANLSPEWLKKLENASARFHISRLESVQLQIQQQIELLYGNQMDSIDSLLKDIVSSGYIQAAYEIQKGLGLGWDITALDQRKLETLLSRPWTGDKKTFRDRCWEQKAGLVSGVQTTLTQGLLRGDSVHKLTESIRGRFGVSRYQAGRLVRTETTYFNALASRETYKDIGVEQIEILESLDGYTCDLCGGLDGTVIPLSQYEPGVTVPPFHPNCRGTTCPHIEDKDGKRIARNTGNEVYYVPANMDYQTWKKTFVDGGAKGGWAEAFRRMSDYIKPDDSFALEDAKSDYETFLQSVPEKNRIYLEQAMAGAEYQQTKNPDVVLAYDKGTDTILFNPEHPMFSAYGFPIVMTHELGHRIDHTMFIQSWKNADFSSAITKAGTVIDADPEKFLAFAKNDMDGFLSDILSAICEDNYRFPAYHESTYWLKQGNKEKEIFANLFSLETFGDETSLDFFRESFPEIWGKYSDFWK